MSADFRLKNPADYDSYYGWTHAHPEMLKEAAYGLPELHREEIKKAKLVACPGCMATSAILGLAPIVKAGLVDNSKIIVDLKVGSSGGGSKPNLASHHPERFSGVRPYQVTGHRHTAEVEQELTVAMPLKSGSPPTQSTWYVAYLQPSMPSLNSPSQVKTFGKPSAECMAPNPSCV
jgi:N-acetyl-gamma-glutamyl-phosphate/LysW-gamma-L-alpha-aminoadipyl-6-phosphate reductase